MAAKPAPAPANITTQTLEAGNQPFDGAGTGATTKGALLRWFGFNPLPVSKFGYQVIYWNLGIWIVGALALLWLLFRRR